MNTATMPSAPTREVLFSDWDSGWNRSMPVTLVTFANGEVNVHRQTGPDFDQALIKARDLLKPRGLTVSTPNFFGPTGAYCPVTKH